MVLPVQQCWIQSHTGHTAGSALQAAQILAKHWPLAGDGLLAIASQRVAMHRSIIGRCFSRRRGWRGREAWCCDVRSRENIVRRTPRVRCRPVICLLFLSMPSVECGSRLKLRSFASRSCTLLFGPRYSDVPVAYHSVLRVICFSDFKNVF